MVDSEEHILTGSEFKIEQLLEMDVGGVGVNDFVTVYETDKRCEDCNCRRFVRVCPPAVKGELFCRYCIQHKECCRLYQKIADIKLIIKGTHFAYNP